MFASKLKKSQWNDKPPRAITCRVPEANHLCVLDHCGVLLRCYVFPILVQTLNRDRVERGKLLLGCYLVILRPFLYPEWSLRSLFAGRTKCHTLLLKQQHVAPLRHASVSPSLANPFPWFPPWHTQPFKYFSLVRSFNFVSFGYLPLRRIPHDVDIQTLLV